jgi:ribosomal protein S18 acetylase RimI-like enzyme
MSKVNYQRLTHRDLNQVAALHEICFPGYYLTLLGPRFLHAMYGWYVESPEAIAHVAVDGHGRVLGFVAGTTEASSYHSSLFRHRARAMLAALLGQMTRHPFQTLGLIWERKDMVPRALSALTSRGPQKASQVGVTAQDESPSASLVSIGVEPSVRRLGIARCLTELFLVDVWGRGSTTATLSVREDNQGARRFYESLGWEEKSRSDQPYHGSFSITYEKNTRE